MFKYNYKNNIEIILSQSKILLLIQFLLIVVILLTLFFVKKIYIEILLVFSLFLIVFGIILTISLLTVRKRIFINQCLEKIVKSDCISFNFEQKQKNEKILLLNKIFFNKFFRKIFIFKKIFNVVDENKRKKLEERIIQSGKLAAMGELTAGIAHELNNPLGGILGYVQFMLEKIKNGKVKSDNDIISIKKYLEFIERETIRCRRIIKNLLQFSRPSQMQIFNNVDLNVILVDSISIVEYQMHSEQVEFIKNLDSTIPLIKGDPVQLQQVFINLLINSMHAIGANKNGKINVSSRLIGNEKDGKMVEIEINDNGCGIPSDIIDKIFDPFFTTKKNGEGTGLGLSLSYGIIKAHKGEITVSSKLNTGTFFTILMPVQNQEKNNG